MMLRRGLNFGYSSWSSRRREKKSSETTSSSSKEEEEEVEETQWEMKPCGMLVQKRNANDEASNNKALDKSFPRLRISVVYGALNYQISANSQSTFGELKKLLTAETGLQPSDQRLIFRGKERGNGDYLDSCGVKDRSKVTLVEDPLSIEKKMVEMRRNAKILAVHRFIDCVSMEVDKLSEQVCCIEKSIACGKKVANLQITTLIEMLMRQAVKLDGIPTTSQGLDSEARAKKDLQEKRVQKCVETLDSLKVLNAKQKVQQPSVSAVESTKWETVTTQWELFD